MIKSITQSKYDVIWNGDSGCNLYTESDCEYASFLKNLDRVCSNKGFLDSSIYTVKLTNQTKDDDGKSSQSLPRSFDIAKRKLKFQEEYEMKMKRINKTLLQEKQEERVLKRYEGDIIKKQYNINKSKRHFENGVSTKKFQEDLKLSQQAENFETQRKKFFFEKARASKDRMRVAISDRVDNIGKSRKSKLNLSKLTREYDAKKNELENSSKEVVRFMEEYESKLAREENRNRILHRELEEISECVNMEMMKLKTEQRQIVSEVQKTKESKHEEDQQWEKSYSSYVSNSDNGFKSAEEKRTFLDMDLAKVDEEHSVQSCQYSGSLAAVRHQLHNSEERQQQLLGEAADLGLLLRKTDYDKRVEEASGKREQLVQQKQEAVATENHIRTIRSEKRLLMSQIEERRQSENDNLNHIKGSLRNEKEREQRLYQQMSEAAKQIQQQSITINRLHATLQEKEAVDSVRINSEIRQTHQQRDLLTNQLLREQARLKELQIQRDGHFQELLSHRKDMRQEEHQLQRSQNHRERLDRVLEKSYSDRGVGIKILPDL